MAKTPKPTSTRNHAWQVQAQTRLDWVWAETREAATRRNGELDDKGHFTGQRPLKYASAFDEITARLQTAEMYLSAPARPWSWLRGTKVEGAWANIHSAHARLVEVGDDDQVRGLLPDVRSALAAYLPANDPARAAVNEAKLDDAAKIGDKDRELLSNALRRAYDANAERYTQLRRYRNILIGAALLFAGLAIALSLVGAANSKTLPLCFHADAKTTACPTGHTSAKGGDVALVALLGMVGGAVGGMASLTRSTRATVTSYTLRVARMLLKVTLGAVAAIVGLMFLRAGFAPGFSELKTQQEVLGYAFLFGTSQQLVTRIADQHGERVLKGASNDSDNDAAPDS